MVNIIDLKREINHILGDKSTEYFKLLTLFFSGRVEKDKVTADVQSLFPTDKLKYHNRFVSFLLGQPVDIDPAIQEKYKNVKERNNQMKRRFDGSRIMTNDWLPPSDNSLAQTVLVGTWAEGLDNLHPEIYSLLDAALSTYLRRVLRSGLTNLRNEPRLPHVTEVANSIQNL